MFLENLKKMQILLENRIGHLFVILHIFVKVSRACVNINSSFYDRVGIYLPTKI